MQIFLAKPRGFCAGVERAVDIVERALQKYGTPIYVRHEIVHNQRVVADLQKLGAIFVDEVQEVPRGSVIIFSAHGVAQSVEESAALAELHVVDATCPLVKKVHSELVRHEAAKRKLVMIGHAGHPEVEGTRGRVADEVYLVQDIADVEKLPFQSHEDIAYVTQTTLSIDDTRDIIATLHARYPNAIGPALQDICYATQNRQQAVKELVKEVELLLVIGARNSSNSNRLREVGEAAGVASYLIDGKDGIDANWLLGKSIIGITAGASTPESLVLEVLEFFQSRYEVVLRELPGVNEEIKFKVPSELRDL